MDESMDEHWEVIYRTSTGYKADILIALLEEVNIPGVIINKQDSSYLFGEFEVYVHRDDVLTARQVVNKIETDE